jgi:hypothetical protein
MKPMNLSDIRAVEDMLFTAKIRELQGHYSRAHAALLNWGAWSRDRSGIYPTLSAPGLFRQYDSSDWVAEEADEQAGFREQQEVKPEPREREEFDERAGDELDTFLHRTFGYAPRRCLLVAYVISVPEYQYPRHASTRGIVHNHDSFSEMFAQVLRQVEEAK